MALSFYMIGVISGCLKEGTVGFKRYSSYMSLSQFSAGHLKYRSGLPIGNSERCLWFDVAQDVVRLGKVF